MEIIILALALAIVIGLFFFVKSRFTNSTQGAQQPAANTGNKSTNSKSKTVIVIVSVLVLVLIAGSAVLAKQGNISNLLPESTENNQPTTEPMLGQNQTSESPEQEPTSGITLPQIAFFVLVIAVAALEVKYGSLQVPTNSEAVISRFKKYQATKKPGLRFIIPIIDHPNIVFMGDQEVRVEVTENIETLEGASVKAKVTYWLRVTDSRRATFNIENGNYHTSIYDLVVAELRGAASEHATNQITKDRTRKHIARAILLNVNAELEGMYEIIDGVDNPDKGWGVKLGKVAVTDITLGQKVQDARDQQAAAEHEKAARITLADGKAEAERREAKGRQDAIKMVGGNAVYVALERQDALVEAARVAGESGAPVFISIGSGQDPQDSSAQVNMLVAQMQQLSRRFDDLSGQISQQQSTPPTVNTNTDGGDAEDEES